MCLLGGIRDLSRAFIRLTVSLRETSAKSAIFKVQICLLAIKLLTTATLLAFMT